MRASTVAICFLGLVHQSSGFLSPGPALRSAAVRNHVASSPRLLSSRKMACANVASSGLRMSAAEKDAVDASEAASDRIELTPEQLERGPGIPTSESEMVSMAATAVNAAFKDGKTRQKCRFLLPRDGKLNPTDEDWPGGIMELYAACSPLTRSFLRKISSVKGGVGAKCTEQRLDESGVDGVSLWTAQAEKAADDLSAFCQPSGEQMDAVQMVCKSAGPRLVLIINPQWRETLDSYDELGKKDGFLGAIGNFLGGTSGTRQQIAELGFEDTYLIEQFVVRGDDVRIVKCYPYPEWYAYTENDGGKVTLLGTSKTRPTYQQISEMFEEKGVAMKWAREAGLGKEFKDE